MGFFSNLFSEKNCAHCGKELGLLGKRKLEDGYLCKDCAALLSPWFNDRRSSTCAQIEEQLAYRARNKEALVDFNPTKSLGNGTKVIIDEPAGCFIVTRSGKWREGNPDIIPLSQVVSCDLDIEEIKTEIMREKDDGTKESYVPPRYDIDYGFSIRIGLDNPYFDEISFDLNSSTIENRFSVEYQQANKLGEEIRTALLGLEPASEVKSAPTTDGVRNLLGNIIPGMKDTPHSIECPCCKATTTLDANGNCEYCGSHIA